MTKPDTSPEAVLRLAHEAEIARGRELHPDDGRDIAATLRALLTELREAREERDAVKPLHWGRAETEGMNLQADCPFGRYYIALRSGGHWFWWRPASSPAHQGCEASEEAAKAAAQADYERRILSALHPQKDSSDE